MARQEASRSPATTPSDVARRQLTNRLRATPWAELTRTDCEQAANEIDDLNAIRLEMRAVLEEVMSALRIHAPGTPLNNHSFDALGIKAYTVIRKAGG